MEVCTVMNIVQINIWEKVSGKIWIHYNRSTFQDLYEDVDYGILTPQTKIKVKVNPSGVVILRCNLNIDDVFRYSPYSPSLNQVYKVRQNSFN